MQKLLFVISQFYKGGAETSLANLLNALDYKKFEVDFVILDQQFFPFEASSFPIRLMNEQEKKEFFFYMESISFGITIDEDGNVVYN